MRQLLEPLELRAQMRCAAHRLVGKDVNHGPALLGAELAAEPDLVRDRGSRLHVGGIAGIDRTRGERVPVMSGLHAGGGGRTSHSRGRCCPSRGRCGLQPDRAGPDAGTARDPPTGAESAQGRPVSSPPQWLGATRRRPGRRRREAGRLRAPGLSFGNALPSTGHRPCSSAPRRIAPARLILICNSAGIDSGGLGSL